MPDFIPAWIADRLTPVDKLRVHRAGLRHMAVSVFVLCGGRLLIQQRAMSKYHTPGLWANSCCTHPHWGEAPIDCARRRLRQELGMAGLTLDPVGQVEYRADVGGGMVEHERVDLFAASPADPPDMSPDPAEVMAVRWITEDDLRLALLDQPADFTPWLRIYMDRHADLVFGRS